jgi:hypothetical protein
MHEPFRRIDSIAAKVYAVLVFLFGVAFFLLAYILYGAMHVSESAVYPAVPGAALIVLSVFIWRGAMWAMLLVAGGVLGLVLLILHDDPSILALLAVPAVFAAFTAVCTVFRIKGRTA